MSQQIGDLISREDTLTAFADYVGSGMSMDDFDALWNIVAKMPAVKQEPKTGHWIKWYEQREDAVYIEYTLHCKCSECGKEYDPYSSQFIKYCSGCGAKMIEPQESEIAVDW